MKMLPRKYGWSPGKESAEGATDSTPMASLLASWERSGTVAGFRPALAVMMSGNSALRRAEVIVWTADEVLRQKRWMRTGRLSAAHHGTKELA